MRPEMADNAMRMVFDPGMAAPWVGVVVLFGAMGYASLRFLRKQPDFPEKPQMLWGAKWLWALTAGLVIVKYLVWYLGALLTDYSFSFMFAGLVVFGWGVFLLLLVLPLQTSGSAACLVPLRAWINRKPVDLPAWLDQEQRTRRSRWYRVGIPATALLLTAYLGYLIGYSYPREREMAPLWEYMQTGALLREQLNSDTVRQVIAGGPPVSERHVIVVQVVERTSTQEAAVVIEQAKRALAVQDRPERWEIRVYASNKGILATGEYVPGPD